MCNATALSGFFAGLALVASTDGVVSNGAMRGAVACVCDCDQATGACENPAKDDGVSCDDGDPCTEKDQCMTGKCVGGSPKVCAACREGKRLGIPSVASGGDGRVEISW